MDSSSPTVAYLSLLRYVIIATYMLHIPFMSMVIGGTLFSVFYRFKKRSRSDAIEQRFSKELIDRVTVKWPVGIILGILPLATLLLAYAQILAHTEIYLARFLLISIVCVISGLVFVYAYRYTFLWQEKRFYLHVSFALFGLALLHVAYFFFFVSTGLIIDPDMWHVF